MLPIVAGIISSLIQNNLPKVAQVVADKGIDYVSDKLGVQLKPEMTTEEITAVKVAAIQHEEFRITADNTNTANARDMQKSALQQEDIFSKRFVYYLASFWSAFASTYIFCVTFMVIPDSSIRLVDTILGFLLGTLIGSIVNFFFGSSKSSADKNSLLMERQNAK